MFVNMSEARWSAFLLISVICVLITLLSLEVNAVPTVSCQASLESSSLDEAIDVIREDLKDVKNFLESNLEQNNASSISRKDFEDLKAACASNQQQNNESCVSRKDFEDLKAVCASDQQQCPPPSGSKQSHISYFTSEFMNHVLCIR